MKTLFYIFGILSILILCLQCQPLSELTKKFQECTKQLEIPDGYSNTEKSRWKCFDACMMKKFKFFSCGKITNNTAVMDYFKKYTRQKIDKAFEEEIIGCMRKANEKTEECQTASAFSHCILKI